jgi:TRAP-type C4-dicarboxylate transport system permease small subunit
MKKNLTFAEEMAKAERKDFIVICISLVCFFAVVVFACWIGLSVYTDEVATQTDKTLAIISNVCYIAMFVYIAFKFVECINNND